MSFTQTSLYVAWKGIETDQRLFWASNANVDAPNSWSSGQNRGDFNSSQGPALTVFNNKLYMAWKGVEGDQRLYWSSTADGNTWIEPPLSRGDINTSSRPALAVFNNRLYMVWKGVQGDQRLYLASTTNPDAPNNWTSGQMRGDINSSQGPALAVFNNKLYMAWKGVEGDQRLFWASAANPDAPNSWSSGQMRGDINTSQGPALAVFNNKLYMVWKGVEGDQRLFLASAANPDAPNNWTSGQMRGDINSSQGPALTVFNNRLYMAWKGVEGDQRLFWASATNPDTPNSWSSGQMSGAINSSQGPALTLVPQVAANTGSAPNSLSFHQEIVTPSGTPLGGWVDLQVQSNGNYQIKFHMHSSSVFGSFDFDLRAYLSAPNGPTFFFHHSGHVSGVDSADYPESGTNPLIAMYWSQLQQGANYTVGKNYKWGGVVGTLDGLVKDILDIGAAVVGTALGTIIAVTREAIGWIHANLGPGGTIGLLSGFVVFAAATLVTGGAAAVILGTVAGVAAGAVSNALIHSRPIAQPEIDVARSVFGNTIPYDKVILTNLSGMNGRAFTAPGVDGKTYCNLGHAYDNPLGGYPKSYPVAGQELIHELTHAWQIAHTTFLPGFMCSAIVNQANYSFGDNVYQYGAAGPDWVTFNLEQQGAIVDQWFGGNGNQASYGAKNATDNNPYYRYIHDNLL